MSISEHATTFAGHKVKPYDPDKGAPARSAAKPVIYRLALDYDQSEAGGKITDLLDRFLAEPAAVTAPALVIGSWGFEGGSSAPIVEALVAAKDRLPKLTALFLGDITQEENEISWIEQSDMSPLLAAFPKLEQFRVRGGSNLSLGRLRHDKLMSLIVESGGLPASVIAEVGAAELPRLEHLELWLGEENYGGIAQPDPLWPLLARTDFKKLHYLGLRDSAIADAVAAAVADAPILKRVKVLDLSLGNLTDAGAEALLVGTSVGKLEELDIHHHFVSEPLVKKLKALGPKLNARDRKEPWDFDPDYRYIAVSE